MTRYMDEKWPWIEGTHGMRTELIGILKDGDLGFNPGGQNMTLGELCQEIGEIESSYIQSLRLFRQDFNFRSPEPGLASNVERLKAWYKTLDDEMKSVVAAFSEEDFKKAIERPGGYKAPVDVQLDIYLQALLIFFGKASIYLKAMSKPATPTMQEYIG
jgi:hypothetical protein